MDDAIDLTIAAHIPVIISAGNDGGAVNKPANCANAIPVGATDANNNVASFSSRGTELAQNGVVAPGVNILTTDVGGGTTGSATGTSFSAPIVAGLAALMISARPSTLQTPWSTIKSNLRNSAVGIGGQGLGAADYRTVGSASGAGLVDGFRAMKLTVEGTLAGFDGDAQVIVFPNPFRPATHGASTVTIPRGLQGSNTSIKIYTMAGQLVRDLGATTSWNGRNEAGRDVATGTYIVLVKTSAGEQKARVAVIR